MGFEVVLLKKKNHDSICHFARNLLTFLVFRQAHRHPRNPPFLFAACIQPWQPRLTSCSLTDLGTVFSTCREGGLPCNRFVLMGCKKT